MSGSPRFICEFVAEVRSILTHPGEIPDDPKWEHLGAYQTPLVVGCLAGTRLKTRVGYVLLDVRNPSELVRTEVVS